MANTLQRTLAAAFLAGGLIYAADSKLVLDGSTTVGPVAKAFAEYYMGLNRDVRVTISESGSGNGAKSLVNGACDIAAMSRAMKDTEFTAAAGKGMQPCPHIVALDGLAVIVHPSNPVKGLTVEQVRSIYTGRIRNWKEVGGADQGIVVVTRDTNSGTYECFETLVMDREKITAAAETIGSNGAARTRVTSTPAALAYVGMGFLDNTVKALDINGIAPDTDAVSSGSYPIARPLFFYTNGYPKLGSHIHAFVTLHLTRKGQEIIESIGFVPTTKY
jgi:phosphate transport system substrate-binding protein